MGSVSACVRACVTALPGAESMETSGPKDKDKISSRSKKARVISSSSQGLIALLAGSCPLAYKGPRRKKQKPIFSDVLCFLHAYCFDISLVKRNRITDKLSLRLEPAVYLQSCDVRLCVCA